MVPEKSILEARHIPPWSIVQIPDGRLGMLGKGTVKGRYLIQRMVFIRFANKTGLRVPANTPLEVIQYPAAIVSEYLAALIREQERPHAVQEVEGGTSSYG